MRFTAMPLSGAYLIQLEPRIDSRGTFSRAFCAREFAAQGLTESFVQANLSTNLRAGIVRGLHFQNAPHGEAKLVQCVKGSVYDVIPARTGYLKKPGEWNEEEITANGRRITVKLNGVVILDANLDIVKEPEVLKKHPGLARTSGHIGLLGHGSRVEFKDLRVREL